MQEMKSSLLEAIEAQSLDTDQLEELEEIVAPACGCGCASGGICRG